MLEEITLDRGFEVKTFKTIDEKNIFDYRERLIRLGVGLRYNMDKISKILEKKYDEEVITDFVLLVLNLSDSKLHFLIQFNDGVFTAEIVFMNADRKHVKYNDINIPTGLKIHEIISDSHFKVEDLHIISKPHTSLRIVLNDVLAQLLKKYS